MARMAGAGLHLFEVAPDTKFLRLNSASKTSLAPPPWGGLKPISGTLRLGKTTTPNPVMSRPFDPIQRASRAWRHVARRGIDHRVTAQSEIAFIAVRIGLFFWTDRRPR